MTEQESLLHQAEKALRDAVQKVVEEARRTHGTIVVWENGAVREIPADQLPPAAEQNPSGGPA